MKRWLLIVGMVIIAGASILTTALLRRRGTEGPTESVDLDMIIPWGDDTGLEYFNQEAETFQDLYPHIGVTVRYLPLGDLNRQWQSGWSDTPPDLAVLSVFTDDIYLDVEHLTPWTGSTWSLYLNTDAVERAGIWNEGIPEEWNRGSLSIQEFEIWMEKVFEGGITPITVGALFAWPLAAWLQHIALSLSGGAENEFLTNGELTQAAATAVAVWNRWRENGWIVDDWADKDWPFSVQDLVNGRSAIALLSTSLASSIPRSSEDRIVMVPFPRGKTFVWTVGSLWNVAIPAKTEHPEEAQLLYDFFTSEGVTRRLTEKLRTTFYSPGGSNQPGMLFASVTNETDSDFIVYIEDIVSTAGD